jgi:hypothetical protein
MFDRRRGMALPLFVALLLLAAFPSGQATTQSEGARQRAYPDFALHAPPINTSPGPEYASWTRL